jgi:nicotinate-nucleotide adenylyltransferase
MEQADRNLRVAFFGGSFDPPHLGHLAVAHAALAAMPLDTVLFAPVGAQPLKPAGSTASFEDRVEMTRLAIANEPAFQLCLADAPRPEGRPNYTLESLQAVKRDLPQDCSLYCLMGADSFAGLKQWYRAAEICFVAPLVVASRPGQPLDDLKAMLPEGLRLEARCDKGPAHPDREASKIELRCHTIVDSAGNTASFYLLPNVDVPISASEIRGWIGREPVDDEHSVLPACVADYIQSRELYR